MSHKVFINDKLYRISIFPDTRRVCDDCMPTGRATTLLVRTHEPSKKEIAICYTCLLKRALSIDKTKQKALKGRKRIATNKQKEALKKAREAKERKRNGILPSVLADSEGQASETKKENGRDRIKTGGPIENITYLSTR